MRYSRLVTFASVMLMFSAGSAHAQLSVLHNFGTISGDPYQPQYSGIIAQGRDGNLYSTALGGANNQGAVFKITPSGTLTVLHSFTGSDGSQPLGGLTLGKDGNFYGTTYAGGTSCCGTIFKVTPSGALTVLYNYPNNADGYFPSAPPVQGTDGNWYGTMTSGGALGKGTVYKMTPAGMVTTLYSFDNTHGAGPHAPLVQGTDGNFYGTTITGGTLAFGVIFKITTAGNLTVLYNFDQTHGSSPVSPLIQGTDGNFYGTTVSGGSGGGGVIFKITSTGTLTVLYDFNPPTDGQSPYGGLVQASDGNFYGTAGQLGVNNDGTLFELTSTGTFSVLDSFDGTDGSTPQVTQLQHTNGILYGDTYQGGTGSLNCAAGTCGVFYSRNASLPAFVRLVTSVGKAGATIGILGQGFTNSSVFTFGAVAASTFTLSGSTYASVSVPAGGMTGPVTVTTTGGTLTSNQMFRVIPQITSFMPPTGIDGTSVTITGVSLTQTTKVTFGGVASKSIKVNSDTSVTVTSPAGAKSGKIAITTAGGSATSSATFTVRPNIASFTPISGAVGTTVTIIGHGFTGAIILTFNGVSATFTVNSDSQVTATVPAGATTGPIAITTSGGTATSTIRFTVT